MKTIIVPTDFSNVSANAAVYATEMAQSIGAKILLVHIVSLPVTISEVPMDPDSFGMLVNEAKQALEVLKEKLTTHTGNKVAIFTLAQVGNITEELEEIAKQTAPFAIVIGSRGHTITEELFLGDTATAILRNSTYPLIMVPKGSHFKKVNKIGLACDMKDVKNTIPLKSIETFASTVKCTIDILYVSRTGDKMNTETLNESLSLQNSLRQFAPQLHYVINEEVERGINNYAMMNDIDMVLIVAKNHYFPSSILHKSVSINMTRQEQVPILVFKEAGGQDKARKANALINIFTL